MSEPCAVCGVGTRKGLLCHRCWKYVSPLVYQAYLRALAALAEDPGGDSTAYENYVCEAYEAAFYGNRLRTLTQVWRKAYKDASGKARGGWRRKFKARRKEREQAEKLASRLAGDDGSDSSWIHDEGDIPDEVKF